MHPLFSIRPTHFIFFFHEPGSFIFKVWVESVWTLPSAKRIPREEIGVAKTTTWADYTRKRPTTWPLLADKTREICNRNGRKKPVVVVVCHAILPKRRQINQYKLPDKHVNKLYPALPMLCRPKCA